MSRRRNAMPVVRPVRPSLAAAVQGSRVVGSEHVGR